MGRFGRSTKKTKKGESPESVAPFGLLGIWKHEEDVYECLMRRKAEAGERADSLVSRDISSKAGQFGWSLLWQDFAMQLDKQMWKSDIVWPAVKIPAERFKIRGSIDEVRDIIVNTLVRHERSVPSLNVAIKHLIERPSPLLIVDYSGITQGRMILGKFVVARRDVNKYWADSRFLSGESQQPQWPTEWASFAARLRGEMQSLSISPNDKGSSWVKEHYPLHGEINIVCNFVVNGLIEYQKKLKDFGEVRIDTHGPFEIRVPFFFEHMSGQKVFNDFCIFRTDQNEYFLDTRTLE
jgi:hypothetical protein